MDWKELGYYKKTITIAQINLIYSFLELASKLFIETLIENIGVIIFNSHNCRAERGQREAVTFPRKLCESCWRKRYLFSVYATTKSPQDR